MSAEPQADQPIDALLSRWLPADIARHVSGKPSIAGPLTGEEADTAAAMAPARRIEFAHGRHCARAALAELGAAAASIPVGDHRAPIWPEGFLGSITHCGVVAGALVARRRAYQGLGIDIEQAGTMDRDMARLICTPVELERIDAGNRVNEERRIFACKEALYKCIWPSLRRYVDFQEVDIEIDPMEQRFVARRSARQDDLSRLPQVCGWVGVEGDLIVAAAYLGPDSRS